MSTLKKYVLIMAIYLILIVAVFSVSQYSGELTIKTKKLQHDIQQEKDTISVLNAEWAYLNTPEHIEGLATHYLKLHPTSARQVVSIKDLMAKIKVLEVKAKKKALYLAKLRKKRHVKSHKYTHKKTRKSTHIKSTHIKSKHTKTKHKKVVTKHNHTRAKH